MPQCTVEVILMIKIAMDFAAIAFGEENFAYAFRERPQILISRCHASIAADSVSPHDTTYRRTH